MLLTVIFVGALLGVVAGTLAGLLGIGGGMVIVPSLVYLLPLLGVSPELIMPMALATSLATIVVTTSSATIAHHKNNNIPWLLVKKVLAVIALGSLTGVTIADKLSAELLQYLFACAMAVLAAYMLVSSKKEYQREQAAIGMIRLSCFITGVLASLMGIGGGAIIIPLLCYFGVPIRQAIGLATVSATAIATFGTLGFVVAGLNEPNLPVGSFGYVYLPMLFAIIATSSFFAPQGVKLAQKLPVATLKKIFAVTLILVAIKMMQ